jgi:hypothetical protein
MELVEGEDLSQRIARGAIPLDEALLIAKPVATALEGAHEQTFINRDLKPISVKYTIPVKGGAVSYTEGAPASGATATIKRVSASTIDSTSSLNGKDVGSTHAVVSADGKTLTRVVKGVDAQGKAFQNTELYERH